MLDVMLEFFNDKLVIGFFFGAGTALAVAHWLLRRIQLKENAVYKESLAHYRHVIDNMQKEKLALFNDNKEVRALLEDYEKEWSIQKGTTDADYYDAVTGG